MPVRGRNRLLSLFALVRRHPLVVMLGALASVLAFVKTAYDAWDPLTRTLGIPYCLTYADRYDHSDGSFRKEGKFWHELSNGIHFEFTEMHRNREYLILRNATVREGPSNTMLLRLPTCGGTAQWTFQNPESWTDLYQIWR